MQGLEAVSTELGDTDAALAACSSLCAALEGSVQHAQVERQGLVAALAAASEQQEAAEHQLAKLHAQVQAAGAGHSHNKLREWPEKS